MFQLEIDNYQDSFYDAANLVFVARAIVASSKKGRPKKEDQSELSRLRAENAKLKEDVEILKKAAKYFASEQP